jgi:hypothetical protein
MKACQPAVHEKQSPASGQVASARWARHFHVHVPSRSKKVPTNLEFLLLVPSLVQLELGNLGLDLLLLL